MTQLCGAHLAIGEVVTVAFALGDGDAEIDAAFEVTACSLADGGALVRGDFYYPPHYVLASLVRWADDQRGMRRNTRR